MLPTCEVSRPRRYSGRNSSRGSGISLVTLLVLAMLAVYIWKLHGGNLSALRAYLP